MSAYSTSTYERLETVTNRYERALLATWREAVARARGDLAEVRFTKEDLVRHAEALRELGLGGDELNVKNTPDIVYTFRARADMPDEIASRGHYAIIGRGKGLYSFVRIGRPNRLGTPAVAREVRLQNRMPSWAGIYVGTDEQAMLTNININELVAYHLGLRSAFQLQSHLRMGVQGYGQVELDAVYVGETREGYHVGIGVDAKDEADNDCLNIAQLFGSGQALRQLFPKIQQRLLGAKPTSDGDGILICEFAVVDDVTRLAEVGEWVKYRLECR